MSLLQSFSGFSTPPINFGRKRRLLDFHKRSVNPHAIVLVAQIPQIVAQTVPDDSTFMRLFREHQEGAHERLLCCIQAEHVWGGAVPVRETPKHFRQCFYGLAPEEELSACQSDDKHLVCFLQDYMTAMRTNSYFFRDVVRAYEDMALCRGESAIVHRFWESVRDDLCDFRHKFPHAPKPPSDDDDPRPRTPIKLSLPSLPIFGLGGRPKTV